MCVAALSNGRVVSGSGDGTLKVWDVSSERCLHTLSGHTDWARRRRPVKPCVDCSPTPRRAQVNCVAALPDGHVVSGSRDDKLKVWDASSGQCLRTLTRHYLYNEDWARRRRPVDTRRRLLGDAVRGAGLLRRRPPGWPHRVRVGRRHAQGLERVDRHLPPDAARAHELSAAPTSSRTARRSLVNTTTGAGRVRRRPAERPHRVRVDRLHAQGVAEVDRRVPPDADRAHGLGTAPASSQTARSIARRRRDGRRSGASSPSRTAASCPGRATARSRCGTRRAVSASRR